MKSSIVPVDMETGEMVTGITMQDEEDRKRAREYFEKHQHTGRRRDNHRPLGEFYMSTVRDKQFDNLPPQDVARLVYLASFMDSSGTLVNDGKAVTLDRIPELLDISPSTADRLWGKIKDVYVSQNDDGSLVVKDCFFFGRQKKKIKEQLMKIFIAKLRRLYESTPKSKRKYLGYIFQLLDQVNIQYNLLSKNPCEYDLDCVRPMTLKEFCAEIGYDVGQSSRLEKIYRSITFSCGGDVQHLCAFVNLGRNTGETYVIINPHIFYAGDCYEQVEVLGLFFK